MAGLFSRFSCRSWSSAICCTSERSFLRGDSSRTSEGLDRSFLHRGHCKNANDMRAVGQRAAICRLAQAAWNTCEQAPPVIWMHTSRRSSSTQQMLQKSSAIPRSCFKHGRQARSLRTPLHGQPHGSIFSQHRSILSLHSRALHTSRKAAVGGGVGSGADLMVVPQNLHSRA